MKGLWWSAVVAVAASIVSGVFSGCNTQGCTENRSALPLMGFYSNATGSRLTLDSLDMGGVNAPGDSLLIQSGSGASTIYLPFRYYSEETAFFFHYDYPEQGLDDPALNDTITFRYSTEPYFESEECGAYYIYTISECRYTTHLVDTVVIVDSVITNFDMERIQVFFRVEEITPEQPDGSDDSDGTDDPDGTGDSGNSEEDTPDSELRYTGYNERRLES